MNKVVLCNIPMKKDLYKKRYVSKDLSLPVSQREVYFPISTFLEKTAHAGEHIKVIMLLKDDGGKYFERNAKYMEEELREALDDKQVELEFEQVITPFSEDSAIHESLLVEIVDRIEANSHIVCDITYGPKDLPIVVFCVLNFAEKVLHCEVDNILYGQGFFNGNELGDTILCDLSPLYYLNAIVNNVTCEDPEKAKELLKKMIEL